jgi:hypothetical protein
MTEDQARTKWPIVGSRSGHSKGYMRLLSPLHPNASKDGYVYRHIYVASIVLKRKLEKHETVHHVDGNTTNDNKNNLLICTHSYHRQLHARLARNTNWPQFTTRQTNNRPICTITGCNGYTTYKSKTGMCVLHYWDWIRSTPIKCSFDNCNENAGHRSGLCRKHLQKIHNAKRYING